jgi:hypothetical protein
MHPEVAVEVEHAAVVARLSQRDIRAERRIGRFRVRRHDRKAVDGAAQQHHDELPARRGPRGRRIERRRRGEGAASDRDQAARTGDRQGLQEMATLHVRSFARVSGA